MIILAKNRASVSKPYCPSRIDSLFSFLVTPTVFEDCPDGFLRPERAVVRSQQYSTRQEGTETGQRIRP